MYGIDLDDELAAEPCPRYGWLLDRILDLPDPYSRFREAMSDDDEMAEMLLEIEESRPDSDGDSASLRYSQVGLRESILMSIDMSLKGMRAEAPHIAGAKGKPKYPKPWPMPVTAVDRLRKKRAKEEARRVESLFGFGPDDFDDE